MIQTSSNYILTYFIFIQQFYKLYVKKCSVNALHLLFSNGRDSQTRTDDLLFPKQARYQAAQYPEI